MINENKKFKLNNLQLIIICLIVSFLFLMICSNNSFLYAFNDNQDVNWFITMGNGLLENKVPYKDLFEQKGPIVYFVFSLFCLFSNPYRAVFIFEIICFAIFLFYCYKIIVKFINEKLAVFNLILISFIGLTSCYFVIGGGSVEEFCLPIFAYMLLCFIEFIHDKKQFSVWRSFIWGVLIGLLFFIKFTLLAFPGIIFIYMVVILIKESKIKKVLEFIGLLFGGVISACAPVIIYFLLHDALFDLLEVYFYNNIFLYGNSTNIFYNMYIICLKGIVPFTLIVLGIIFYQQLYKTNYLKRGYIILFVSYTIFLVISGNFIYYYLPLIVFVPLGVAFSSSYLLEKYPKIANKQIYYTSSILLLLSCILFGNGTLELDDKKSDYIHFQIAEDIRTIDNENPTLFCYKLWDYGFYNVLGVTPNVKYYANNLLEEDSFPEMYNEFKSYILNKETKFLLVDKQVFEDEYEFISSYYDYYKTYSYHYYKDNERHFQMTLVLLTSK